MPNYFAHAFRSTFATLGGSGALIAVIAVPLVGFALHLLQSGWDAMSEELQVWWVYGLQATGVVALALYGWNLACAPHRIEREKRIATEAKYTRLQRQMPKSKAEQPAEFYTKKEREEIIDVATDFILSIETAKSLAQKAVIKTEKLIKNDFDYCQSAQLLETAVADFAAASQKAVTAIHKSNHSDKVINLVNPARVWLSEPRGYLVSLKQYRSVMRAMCGGKVPHQYADVALNLPRDNHHSQTEKLSEGINAAKKNISFFRSA